MSDFMIKRIIGGLLMPLPLILMLLLLVVVLWFFMRRMRFSWICLLLAVAMLAACSFPHLVRRMAYRLESLSQPVMDVRESEEKPYAIVILGSNVDHPGDNGLPALSRLGDTARARLVEGVRLARLYPDAKVATSGYGFGLESCAEVMAEAAVELGVEPSRLVRFSDTMDTENEAKETRRLAGDKRVVLVTSAVHMPRSLVFFRQQKVNVFPAPCDYIAPSSSSTMAVEDKKRWTPRGENIANAERTAHELLGLLYQRWFRGGETQPAGE